MFDYDKVDTQSCELCETRKYRDGLCHEHYAESIRERGQSE